MLPLASLEPDEILNRELAVGHRDAARLNTVSGSRGGDGAVGGLALFGGPGSSEQRAKEELLRAPVRIDDYQAHRTVNLSFIINLVNGAHQRYAVVRSCIGFGTGSTLRVPIAVRLKIDCGSTRDHWKDDREKRRQDEAKSRDDHLVQTPGVGTRFGWRLEERRLLGMLMGRSACGLTPLAAELQPEESAEGGRKRHGHDDPIHDGQNSGC